MTAQGFAGASRVVNKDNSRQIIIFKPNSGAGDLALFRNLAFFEARSRCMTGAARGGRNLPLNASA